MNYYSSYPPNSDIINVSKTHSDYIKENFSTETSPSSSLSKRLDDIHSSNDIYGNASSTQAVIQDNQAKQYSCHYMGMKNNGSTPTDLKNENGDALKMLCNENNKGQGTISCSLDNNDTNCCLEADSKIMYYLDPETNKQIAYCTGTNSDLVWVAEDTCKNSTGSQCIQRFKKNTDTASNSWKDKPQCDAAKPCYTCNPKSTSNNNWIQPIVKATTDSNNEISYSHPGKTYNNCEWLQGSFIDEPVESINNRLVKPSMTKGECSQYCISQGIKNSDNSIHDNNGEVQSTIKTAINNKKDFKLNGPLCLSLTSGDTDTGKCYYLPTGSISKNVGTADWTSNKAISTCNGIYNTRVAAEKVCKYPDNMYTCPPAVNISPTYSGSVRLWKDSDGKVTYNTQSVQNTDDAKNNCFWPKFSNCSIKSFTCQDKIETDSCCGYSTIDGQNVNNNPYVDTCDLCSSNRSLKEHNTVSNIPRCSSTNTGWGFKCN